MVAERNGLRLLQVGVGRDDVGGVGLGQVGEQQGETGQGLLLGTGASTEVEAQIEGYLVVAGASGVELPPHRAHQLHQTPLHRGVHVLVAFGELEAPLLGLLEDAAQAIEEAGGFVLVEEAHLAQHLDVGQRPGDVVHQQPSVGGIHRVPPQHLVGGLTEAPTPQGHAAHLWGFCGL